MSATPLTIVTTLERANAMLHELDHLAIVDGERRVLVLAFLADVDQAQIGRLVPDPEAHLVNAGAAEED